jgi:hypothetical protein
VSRHLWIKNNLSSLCFPLLISILFAGLRGNVGTDTFVYKTFFNTLWSAESLTDKGLIFPFEPGFILYSHLIKIIYDNDQFFIFSIALLYGFLFYKLLKLLEEKDLFFLFYISTFFVMFNLNLLRFGISIILVGLSFLSQNKNKKIFYLALAFSFHFSAIFSVLFFIKKEHLLKYLIALITIFLVSYNFIQAKLNSYLLNFLFSSKSFQIELTFFLEILVIFFLIRWNSIKLKDNNLFLCVILYLIFRCFGFLTDLIYRLSYAFGFVIYLSFFINKLNYKSRLLITLLVFFYTYRTLSFIYNSDGAMSLLVFNESGMSSLYSQTKWLPYRFFWEE